MKNQIKEIVIIFKQEYNKQTLPYRFIPLQTMQIFFKNNKRSFINRSQKIERLKRKRKLKPKFNANILIFDYENVDPPTLKAPNDFRLVENAEEVLKFIHLMRHNKSRGKIFNRKAIRVSLKDINLIDYAALSVLKAVGEDLRQRAIFMNIDLPLNKECKKYLIDSGFLDHMFDQFGKKFQKVDSSDEVIFERGFGKLTKAQNKKIGEIVKNMMYHLTGLKEPYKPLKMTIMEICGNSIEHAYSNKGQWSLSVKYEKKCVLFTVTDVGRGILDTLYRKHSTELREVFLTKDTILHNAFIKKYGSSTFEENRNKGLPMIKSTSDQKFIQNLKVATNDVLLHFDEGSKSQVFKDSKSKFSGTLYEWKVTPESILHYKNGKNKNITTIF